jgi:hypothetical protein
LRYRGLLRHSTARGAQVQDVIFLTGNVAAVYNQARHTQRHEDPNCEEKVH